MAGTINESIQTGINTLSGVLLDRKDPVLSLTVGVLNSIFGEVISLQSELVASQRKVEALEKAVGTIPVDTYAALVAYPKPEKDTFFSVAADEQNNPGKTSIYMKNAAGEIILFAAQKMN